MPSLPIATDFTGAGVTEAGFKTAITNQREFLAGLLGTTGNQIDALIALGSLGADTVSKTANYTVVAADRGKTILCDGTFTLSLTAAATLADGFIFLVKNIGSGTITIDPNSTELIDGANTKTLAADEWCVVNCTGTAFVTFGSSVFVQEPSITLLGTLTTTSGSSQTLSGLDLTPYKQIQAVINNVGSTSTAGTFRMLNGATVGFLRDVSATATDVMAGYVIVDLETGIYTSATTAAALSSKGDIGGGILGSFAGDIGFSTASTSIGFSLSTGSFDGGSILIYGIR